MPDKKMWSIPMTKYLPWFLFLTGIQSYASITTEATSNTANPSPTHATPANIANNTGTPHSDSQLSRDFASFTCKAIKKSDESHFDQSVLIELRKNPTSLTNTLKSKISFNMIIKPHQGQAAVYVNGGVFAVLKKEHAKNTYSLTNNYYDQKNGDLHQSIYRVDQIQLDDFLHQITARLRITKRTISHHSVRPHYSEHLTRTYHCVTE